MFLDGFDMLIFIFCQNFKVNNLATSRSILGHIFEQHFAQQCGQILDLEMFTCFLVKTCFFENLILPAERRRFLKNKKQQKQ